MVKDMSDVLSGELKAMAQIEATLKDLTDEERVRVMQWASARFRLSLRGDGGKVADPGRAAGDEVHPDLETFYAAAQPKTDAERALVVAYWLQYRESAPDVDTQTVNTRLKHLGYGTGHITRAFETLKDERPALVVQTKKEGSTQQARKKFKVTTEGKKRVEGMLKVEG
jgi:hypothetical protein